MPSSHPAVVRRPDPVTVIDAVIIPTLKYHDGSVLIVSNDTASVSDPACCPTVIPSVHVPPTPLMLRHLAALSDVHFVASHAVPPPRISELQSLLPSCPPMSVIVTPCDAILARGSWIGPMCALSKDKASVSDPDC
jgi:hypothetical protein